MSTVAESRSETRQCDACKHLHKSSMSYESPSNAKWINFPWRKVEVNDKRIGTSHLTMCLDICSQECMIIWIKNQIEENSEFFQLVRVELEDKKDQT